MDSCLEPPVNRLGEQVFSPHVLDAAKRHSVVLINSVELYWVICGVLSGRIDDYERIREAVLTTNGHVDLRRFRGPTPFRAEEST